MIKRIIIRMNTSDTKKAYYHLQVREELYLDNMPYLFLEKNKKRREVKNGRKEKTDRTGSL